MFRNATTVAVFSMLFCNVLHPLSFCYFSAFICDFVKF